MNDLLCQLPPKIWAAGQLLSVAVTPLTLAPGRLVTDFTGFMLNIRSDPLWPRIGINASQLVLSAVDPLGQGWPLVLTVSGALVSSVPTFVFTMVNGSGIMRYAFDVWGQLNGGEIQLVRPWWLTCGARVEAIP